MGRGQFGDGPYVNAASRGPRKYRHRVIAADTLGRPLPSGACVHHVDGNGRNNARRNLVICQSLAYHNLLHARQRVIERGGDPNVEAWCYRCRMLRPLTLFWYRKTGYKAGRPAPGCKICSATRRKGAALCPPSS